MIEYRTPKTNMFASVRSTRERANVEPEVDWSRVRRARPLDRVLPGTQQWAQSLPMELTPDGVVRMYPRIANYLAIAWQDPNAVQEVLDDVLIDRRGGRQGFPPPVQKELLRLKVFNQGRLSARTGRLPA